MILTNITDVYAAQCYLCCAEEAGHCPAMAPDDPCRIKGCPAGCGINDAETDCLLCETGYYSDDNSGSCRSCSRPQYDNIDWVDQKGMTTNDCPWLVTCKRGEYWADGTCISCSSYNEHYVGNNSSYKCEGSGNEEKCGDTSPGSYCTGATYTINLDKNMPYTHAPDYDKYINKELSYKYEAGYKNGSNWSTKTVESSDFKQPTHNYLEFTGYYTKASDGDLVIDADGKISESYQGNTIEAFIGGTSTLYAQYKVNEIEITYKNTNGYTKSQTFDIGDDSNSTNRKVIDIITGWTPAGQKFKHWECTAGCDAGKIYEADDVFEFTEELDRTLTAQYEDCPAGYYCYDNTAYPCPGGSTSDAGKSTIQDCYMSAETYFIDSKEGKFTLGDLLGDNAKIYRHY